MKKLLLCTLLLLYTVGFLMAQTTIVQWNFNNSSTTPSLGQLAATINTVGGASATFTSGIGTPDDPGPGDKGYNTATYPNQGTEAKSRGIQIDVSTAGYNNIHLQFYIRHSKTAARKVVIQVGDSVNAPVFYTYDAPNNESFSGIQDFNLSLATAVVNNNSTLKIRIVTDFSSGSNYQAQLGETYGSGGTIRYDLITIIGNSIGCGSPATQQATGLRLLKTDNSSAQLSLNRGNGTGCLVLCSVNALPNTTPVNGTNYAANSIYGSGPMVGNAFAVYNTQLNNPSTHYFNINGLTAGTKYYVAAYEYSSTGYCYLTPGTVDSFYCNSTILYPGDMQFVGYDNNDSSGRDVFVLTNLKELKTGTSFQIVNSRFEAGAAANVRTNQWYAGSNDPYQDLQRLTLTYTGSMLPAGSIISLNHVARTPGNIRINNSITTDLTITDNFNIGNLLSGSASEQFFLTQGKFTASGTVGTDRYSILDGHVLHGISYVNSWVDFNQPCGVGTNRQSRLPTDIKCLNLYFSGTSNFGYYQPTQNHVGSQGLVLSQINTLSKWTFGTGGGGNDIDANVFSTQFTVSPSPTTANWTGSASTDWFNCTNWENLYVPDSTADVTVATLPTAAIAVNGALAAEYSNLATTRNLNITAGTVNLSGTSADKLIVYDVLQTGSNGSLTTNGSAIDTIVVRGSIQSQNVGGLQLNNNGWLSLHGNRQLNPINVSLASTTLPVGVSVLSLNNPPGININNGGFESLNKLELANGILSPTATNAFHYLGVGCTLISPVNFYGETNKGWEKSYIDSKVYLRTAATTSYTAPLGSKQKGVFAPLILKPDQNDSRLYEAGYVGTSHPNTAASDINNPPITKVSTQEYWTLTSNPNNSAANLTLYYTPLSFVAGQPGTDAQALRDLQIVQYWDSSRASPRKWRLPSFPVSTFNSGPGVQYGKISMTDNYYVTSLIDADKNFTLGSASIINTLPVQITAWAARLQGNRTQLTWQVQQETGTAFYVVEKSLDGKTFHPLQTVYAFGLPTYACFDNAPADGWNYYRLKVTDLSGKASSTAIEKVWLKHTSTFAVFPNPAADKVFITLPSVSRGTIALYAPDGRKCITQAVSNNTFVQLNIKGLPTGWYLLEYIDGKNRLTQKLMIK